MDAPFNAVSGNGPDSIDNAAKLSAMGISASGMRSDDQLFAVPHKPAVGKAHRE
eukprot:CAMPEP_0172165556 /NCGR_PEP_ID=MMETSP1050-20130122/8479_1 /TAXON_ID=233186 /ORGANISM="Cryptomonas curvata, Strain CCAP979/52" /LENGTH=53 /DNA_ID=CAMNT_0012836043 /DNA_START=183 /DNA_END=344 /DNA_ORIENTATION=-